MSKRVKVAGYSQKVKTNSGIEYRNFSDSLVGNQYTSDGGSTLFTLGNFRVTTNLDPKSNKTYRTNQFSNFYTLDTLTSGEDNTILKDGKDVSLNLDRTDITNYAYFGSLKEYMRVSLENIISSWPASLFVNSTNQFNPGVPNPTFEEYIHDDTRNVSTFKVHIASVKNDFGINIKRGGTISNTYNENNKLRDLTSSYTHYTLDVNGEIYPIMEFSGYGDDGFLIIKVKGNPFASGENVNYHIKPTQNKIKKFFMGLNEFESHLLNRQTNFKAEFKFDYESENGNTILGRKTVKWPITDGYNIDFQSEYYVEYVNQLLEIAEINDKQKSNIIVNRLVSSSIFEFDTIDQKMTKTLKIYGRNLDEVKRETTGIKFAHTVTYDKKNNIPDELVKNLARTMGWELTSSLFNVDFNENFLNTDGPMGLTPVESEIEFWRRLILNSPWVWKSKGTRKVVEFLLKFVGTPKGLINFNEYIYKAEKPVNMDDLRIVLEHSDLEYNEEDFPLDSEGYPIIPSNTNDMYFQKGGMWYRQTAGEESNVDVLTGNNPHVGPYDGGYEYISQFNDIVPNFKPITLTNKKVYTSEDKGFTNYDNGRFNKYFDNTVVAEIDLNIDFQNIYQTNLTETVGSDFDFEECKVETTWYLDTYLDGEHRLQTLMQYDDEYPNETVFLSALEQVNQTLSLTSERIGNTYRFYEDMDGCTSELADKKLEFNFRLDFEYGCKEYAPCGDLVVTYKRPEDSLVVFENANNNVVPQKECCRDLGYTSKLVDGGFECYNQVEPITPETDIYVFMSTSSLSLEDAEVAKQGMVRFYNSYKEEYSDYDGDLYILPIDNEDWLDYPNKVWDGVVAPSVLSGWDDIAVLPSNINTSNWTPPEELLVVAFIDESNSSYHGESISDGFQSQPTSHFVNHYNTLRTHLTYTDFKFFQGVVYPVVKDPQGETGAFILHSLAAIEGTTLTPKEIQELNSPVDLSLISQENPYRNHVVDEATQERLMPLKQLNWSSIYSKSHPASDVYSSDRFIKDLYNLLINIEDDNIYTVDSTSIDASETDISI